MKQRTKSYLFERLSNCLAYNPNHGWWNVAEWLSPADKLIEKEKSRIENFRNIEGIKLVLEDKLYFSPNTVNAMKTHLGVNAPSFEYVLVSDILKNGTEICSFLFDGHMEVRAEDVYLSGNLLRICGPCSKLIISIEEPAYILNDDGSFTSFDDYIEAHLKELARNK